MSHEFRLADIGEGLEEAEIIEWKVQVGDHVRRDQTIVEVMTDKSNADLPAPVDGVIVALGATVGDMVQVGSVLAVIDPPVDEPAVDEPVVDEPAAAVSRTSDVDGSAGVPSAPAPSVSTFQVAAATTASAGSADAASAPHSPAADETPANETAADVLPEGETASAPTADVYVRPSRPKASPTTRVEAARRGIDLSAVTGTGPGGRILLTDLDELDAEPSKVSAAETHAGATAPAPVHPTPIAPSTAPPTPTSPQLAAAITPDAPAAAITPDAPTPDAPDAPDGAATVEPLRGIRRAIARNMHQSWTDIPHIHAFRHIDAEPLLELRDHLRTSGRSEFESLTPLSFFVAAVANAIEQHPIANATLDLAGETITHHDDINVGVAVAAPQGLVVPVIHDAGNQSLATIAAAVRATVDGARTGSLPASAFRNGSVTITNFGSLGGEQALPLIRPPESAIFGFGSIEARPFVIDDQVVARKTMHLVIATDHRLLDGDVTTALLGRVASLLENPINLVLGD